MDTIIRIVVQVIFINLIFNSIMFIGRKIKQLISNKKADKRFNEAQKRLKNKNTKKLKTN